MMSNDFLKHKWAEDSKGNIVNVKWALKGKTYYRLRSNKTEPLILKSGSIRTQHFALKNPCNMSDIHLLHQEALMRIGHISLQCVENVFTWINISEVLYEHRHNWGNGKYCVFDNVIVDDNGTKIVVEFNHTHEVDAEKWRHIIENKMIAIEIKCLTNFKDFDTLCQNLKAGAFQHRVLYYPYHLRSHSKREIDKLTSIIGGLQFENIQLKNIISQLRKNTTVKMDWEIEKLNKHLL